MSPDESSDPSLLVIIHTNFIDFTPSSVCNLMERYVTLGSEGKDIGGQSLATIDLT